MVEKERTQKKKVTNKLNSLYFLFYYFHLM